MARRERWEQWGRRAIVAGAFVMTLAVGAACSGAPESPKKDQAPSPTPPKSGETAAPKPAAGSVLKQSAVLGPGMPESEVRLVFGSAKNFLERIEIGGKGEGSPAQQTISYNAQLAVKTPELKIVDMNFDGYKDLRLLVSETDKINSEKYKFWLYDPAAKKFTANAELETLCNPSFDADNKLINSMCGSEAGKLELKSYSLAAGALKLVRQGRVEAFYNPDFFVRIIKSPGQKAAQYYEVTDHAGKLICRTDQPPLACDAVQTVALFTLAEENFSAGDMVKYYTENVLWRGQKKTRKALEASHGEYLKKINSYDLEISNFKSKLNADQTKAMVEATVAGGLKDKRDQMHEFSVEKRFRLVKQNGEWKIECEEVYKYNNVQGEPTTNVCTLP
jgi:hypothetical protein